MPELISRKPLPKSYRDIPLQEAAVRFCIHRATCSRGTQALITSWLLTLAPISGVAQPATAPAQQACAAGEARSAVGQPYSPELAKRARGAAGAREVRKIEPDPGS